MSEDTDGLATVPRTAGLPGSRGNLQRGLLTGVVLAVVLATGVGIGILIPIVRAPSDASAEVGFARDMSSHHAQAVEMSMLAVQKSSSTDIRGLALDMGLTQQAQIGIMRSWLQQWNKAPTSTGPRMAWMHHSSATSHNSADRPAAGVMPGMVTTDEMNRLRTATGRSFDILFCELMIRHHRGGITMVEAILAADPEPLIRQLASSMKNGQQSEITALAQLSQRVSP